MQITSTLTPYSPQSFMTTSWNCPTESIACEHILMSAASSAATLREGCHWTG